MNNKNNNKTFYQITSLITLAVAGLMMVIGTKQNIVTQGQYKAPQSVIPIYDYKEITITKSNFAFDGNKNTYNDFTLGTGAEAFNYTGTINKIATTNGFKESDNPWFAIRKGQTGSSATYPFSQINEAGSALNKWHLTSLTMTVARHSSTNNSTNTVSLNNVEIFSYEKMTDSLKLGDLNPTQSTYYSTFNYEDNITTFEIKPNTNLYVSSMTLGYTIDYSNC